MNIDISPYTKENCSIEDITAPRTQTPTAVRWLVFRPVPFAKLSSVLSSVDPGGRPSSWPPPLCILLFVAVAPLESILFTVASAAVEADTLVVSEPDLAGPPAAVFEALADASRSSSSRLLLLASAVCLHWADSDVARALILEDCAGMVTAGKWDGTNGGECSRKKNEIQRAATRPDGVLEAYSYAAC